MAKLSIEERLGILSEAAQFYSDLSASGKENELLGKIKAAALSAVEECLELYKRKMLNDGERTEESLKEGLALATNEDAINLMIKNKEMNSLSEDFYKGGFGLAIGILEGDEDTINGLRELETQYDEILEAKAGKKTIADLLK